MKKLHILLIFSNLVVSKSLSSIIAMHNFIAKFRKNHEICKQFAENQVNESGNVPRRGVVPTFSDLQHRLQARQGMPKRTCQEHYSYKKLFLKTFKPSFHCVQYLLFPMYSIFPASSLSFIGIISSQSSFA